MQRRRVVIVHAACPDGFTAAWLFKKFKGDAEFVYANYGDDPPDVTGAEVWMIDFSYPRKQMIEKIIIPSFKTTVFDHHRTAQADLDKLDQEIRKNYQIQRDRGRDTIVFDMDRSGAGIAFDYFEEELNHKHGFKLFRPHGNRKVRLVDYIEDRDLWKWQQPGSREYSAWVFTLPFTFEAWDELERTPVEDVVKKGAAILKYIDCYGERACEMARLEPIGDYKVPTINVPYMNCSDHINKLLEKNPQAPFVAGYFKQADGKWQVSLRSTDEFDCSEIAKQFGGGGHKRAAGFKVDKLPWEKASK